MRNRCGAPCSTLISNAVPTPPCGPMMSRTAVRSARSTTSVCSFASESSCTRPCCIRTRETACREKRGFSEKSPCMIGLLIGVDDSGLHPGGGRVLEPRAQVSDALGQIEVVEGAHLRLVLGAASDLLGAVEVELAVIGRAVSDAAEARRDAAPFLFDCRRLIP